MRTVKQFIEHCNKHGISVHQDFKVEISRPSGTRRLARIFITDKGYVRVPPYDSDVVLDDEYERFLLRRLGLIDEDDDNAI